MKKSEKRLTTIITAWSCLILSSNLTDGYCVTIMLFLAIIMLFVYYSLLKN